MKNIWFKKVFLTIFCVCLVISPLAAKAQAPVIDPSNLGQSITEFVVYLKDTFKDSAGAVAYKNALSAFLSKAAYDAAVWVSSSGTGQQSLVYTQPWDEYLLSTGDAALGEGINSLVDDFGFENFNVCSPPDSTLRLNLALGLQTSLIDLDEPECTLTEMGANWAELVEPEDFSELFTLSFDPAENEIGTYLTIQSSLVEKAYNEEEAAKLARETDGPVASKVGAVSQYIQTPGDWINDSFKSSIDKADSDVLTYTGEAVADAMNVFSSTLFSKLTERLRNGFITETTTSGTSLSGLISGQTGGTTGGVAAAKATYATINQPTFNPGGEIDSAYTLLEEGVIDQTFQLAIENQWSLQEFIDYLNDNIEGGAGGYLFGVSSDEISSPSAGITRRGVYLLKKYRIVPVGWQIAADLIYYNRNNADFSGITLGVLADCADGDCLFNNCGVGEGNEYSEFCKLIDPDWVLKSPQAYCAKESYGLSTVYDDFLDQDGNEYNQEEHVLTREQTCVDEMTCINEDSEGNCYDYGYCIKDKRTYQFEGEGCSEEVASCQSFERQSDGSEVSYLTNTLNYGECNNDDALGCTWYCQDEGNIEGNWGCTSATQSYTECSEDDGGVEQEYCYCSKEETCNTDIYDSTCLVAGETCTLSEICSPENDTYFGTGCACSLIDSAYMGLGDADGVVNTDNYGWSCSLDDTTTCETTSDSYFTYVTCDSQTCATGDNCTIYEGEYSCENDDEEECYIELADNEPQDLATVYLNGQVEECDGDDAGCREFIRARGNNLLFNSSFEDYDDIENDYELGICSNLEYLDPLASPYCHEDTYCQNADGEGYCVGWKSDNSEITIENNDTSLISATSYGSSSVYLSGSTTGSLSQVINYDDYELADRSFAVSLQAYGDSSKSCSSDFVIQLESLDSSGTLVNEYDVLNEILSYDSIWTSYTSDLFTFPADETGTQLQITIPNDCEFYLDAVQLEESNEASSYNDYGTAKQVYLNEGREECLSSEVGCKLYAPATGKFREEIPGIITNENSDACVGTLGYADPDCSQCDEDYVGCDYYQEQALDQTVPLAGSTTRGVLSLIGATTGTQSRLAINDRIGSYCSGDQSISCFNNSDCGSAGRCLDTISLVPSTAESCSVEAVGCESYTNLGTIVEGGEGTEYYNYLKQCVTTADSEVNTYYSWEGSDESGYQLKSSTLKLASDGAPCTNLDLTEEDYNSRCIDVLLVTANDCGPDGDDVYGTDPNCILYYNADGADFYRYEEEVIGVDDECIPLRNDNDGRTYYMLPEDSISCSSSSVGCREYKGSEGSNVKLLINDDFSDCSIGDWLTDSGSLDAPSESVYVDDCSLSLTDSAYYPLYSTDDEGIVSPYLEEGNSYVATFWAKGDSGEVSIDLEGNLFTETVTLSDDWQEYSVGPLFLSATTIDEANLEISYSGSLAYFDSFYLQESESQYLIQGSADLCQGYEGCQTYKDEDATEHYLKSFAKLCTEDKIGCDIAYDSQNTSNNPYAHRYNLSNEYSEDDLIISSDEINYLVLDDENTECNSEQKGCQSLGEPEVNIQDGSISSWVITYLVNDPDSYDSILCQYQHLGCGEYESPYDGMMYFKDPGNKTCTFNSTDNVWYKTDSDSELCDLFNPNDSPSQPMGSVCDPGSADLEGEYCQEDDDCGDGRCINTEDDSGWVGICTDEDSGCTQYSDPYTGDELMTNYSFEYDEINNITGATYEEDDTRDNEPDYWYSLADHDTSDTITERDIEALLGLDGPSTCETFQINESEAHNYSNSLEIQSGEGACVVLAEYKIAVNSNETYNLGVYAKTDDDYMRGLRVGLLYYDEDENSLLTAEDSQGYLAINYPDEEFDDEWHYYHGTIGHGRSVEFPENTTHVWPFLYIDYQSVYIDEFSFNEEEDYYYLDYTIDGTEEGSVSGTTTDECVTGINVDEGCLSFRDNTREDLSYLAQAEDCDVCTYSNEGDTCTAAADSCDTNTIIKVRPDRVCDQWIDCYYYNEVISDDGSESELECLGLGICKGINDEGDCIDWAELPSTPDGNDDLTYISQADAQSVDALDEIKDYTGYSKVGMIWPSIKSCDGGYEDGQSCDEDVDCEDRGVCTKASVLADPDICSGGSLAGTECALTGLDQCHNESGDGVCSGQFVIQGYYPYAAMVEYGDLNEEAITDGGFEELYCEGQNNTKVDTDSPCIITSHCNNLNIDAYNESVNEGIYDVGVEITPEYNPRIDTTGGSTYYCPSDYGNIWAFDNWAAEDEAGLQVVQYSEDETYGGDSRFNWSDNTGETYSTYAEDWNNVLKVNVDSGSAEGVKRTGLGGSVAPGNTYSLSFKGKYTEGFDSDDLLNVGLRHTDSNDNEYTDWFAKGAGMVDIVFVFENIAGIAISTQKQNLINSLDDIAASMGEGISYRAALVESNSSGANLIQDLTTFDVIDDSIDGLSRHSVVGGSCNLDAVYDTISDDVNDGSINYRSESEKVIVLITDVEGAQSSSCIYSSRRQDLSEDLLSSEDAVYYIFATSTPYDQGYQDIAVHVSGSDSYLNDVSSDYGSVLGAMSVEVSEEAEIFQLSTVWTDHTLGPLTITEKPERTADTGEISTDLVIYQSSDSSGADFIIDDVSLLPTLEVNKELDTLSRDCRAYPEESSLSCSYYEGVGNYYRGWMGYCLEYDPEDKNNCLVWWPTDRIKGESFISSLRTEAGYSERSQLYHCLVSKGYAEVGFCAETDDINNIYAGTTSAPTIDYNSETGSDSTICNTDGDCSVSEICFKGADISLMLEPGSHRGVPELDRVSFLDGFSNQIYPTLTEDVTQQHTGIEFYDLYTNDYKAVTRRFHAPITAEEYQYIDSDGNDDVYDLLSPDHETVLLLKYVANPIERNIHISEVEKIELNPGYSGFAAENAFSPGDIGINLIDVSNVDWDNVNGDDAGSFCQSNTGGQEGFGCYWARHYQDADDTTDMIYTYAFSSYMGSSMGSDYNGLLDDISGDVDAQAQEIFGGGNYKTGTVGGYDLDQEDQRRDYQNPWNHLDIFNMYALSDNYNNGYIGDDDYDGDSSVLERAIDAHEVAAIKMVDNGEWWRATSSTDEGGNVVSLYFDFDDQGYLEQIFALTWFGSENTGEDIDSSASTVGDTKELIGAPTYEQPMELTYYLREPCAVIAEGIDSSGDGYSWSSRISDTNYVLPGSLNIYEMYADLDEEPFGAIPPHASGEDPTYPWDGLPGEEINNNTTVAPLVMEDDDSFNAGWPISCIGNCTTRVCSTDYEISCSTGGLGGDCPDNGACIGVGGICKDDDEELTGDFCSQDSDCDTGDCYNYNYDEKGLGDGPDYESQVASVIDTALDRYKYLIAEPLGIYTSSINSSGYSWAEEDVDFEDFALMESCPDNQRSISPYTRVGDDSNEYCGVRPEVAEGEIKVNGYSSGQVIVNSSQKITLSFTSEVDSEQLPLEKIYIDWYGANWDDHDWGYGATNHVYSWYSNCSESSANYCYNGAYRSDDSCDTSYNGYCVYRPRVTLVDHWGWASGVDGGDDNRAYYGAGYTLRPDPVYDEFDGVLLVNP